MCKCAYYYEIPIPLYLFCRCCRQRYRFAYMLEIFLSYALYYVYLRVPCHLLCEELSSNGGAWDVQAWSPFLSYTMFSLNEQNSLKLNFVSRNIALVISSALCILKSIFQFLFHSQWFFFLIFETPYLLDAGI